MGASANLTGSNNQQEHQESNLNENVGVNGNGNLGRPNENSDRPNKNSGGFLKLKHNPGISAVWTSDELTILENGLAQYASVSTVIRYAKIAMELPSKTARDVALRAKWMNKKEFGKRRKEDHPRKSNDKWEKVTESSSKSSQLHISRPAGHPYPVPLDEEDGISCSAIGGPTGELLTQNQHFFQQISSNFNSYQFQENLGLLSQARDNLLEILNACSDDDTPEIMKQIPPLPVKLNEELARNVLPTTNNHQKSQCNL